jgi:hypothetical protein
MRQTRGRKPLSRAYATTSSASAAGVLPITAFRVTRKVAALTTTSSFLRSGRSTLTVTSFGVTPSTLICRSSRPASFSLRTFSSLSR